MGNYRNKVIHEEIQTPFDIGHIYGREHWRLVLVAKEVGLTQKEFNAYVNARPEFFKPENASLNRSRINEKKGIDGLDDIKDDMKKFKSERK
ncbi:hypothetical protein F9B74_09950 [Pelistega sp. NLN82]|uniref:Toxin YqcG C-terminal domain-containing protein n=1 Tax=Pelistega ratti TaxID=2652177 RepID=A0A6L9Y8C1_9BURK|nr:GH-E family nuclease [Pelistega ratti]NEN76626.1 hypothetical protein [Pelistega ratti]